MYTNYSLEIMTVKNSVDQKGMTSSIEKKRPEGPSSGNNASLTGFSTPSSMLNKPWLWFMSVLTEPGHIQFMQK